MPTYVVPETVEHAIELLECGLLYRNGSPSVPRMQQWGLCSEDERMEQHIRSAYNAPNKCVLQCWHYTDFAYVLEE